MLKFLYFWSAFFDNWYYLFRIGVYSFKDPKSSELVSRLGTSCTILSYSMELGKEWTDARAKGNTQKMRKALWDRRWYILSKLLEYPVSLVGLRVCADANILLELGAAVAVSRMVPFLVEWVTNHFSP